MRDSPRIEVRDAAGVRIAGADGSGASGAELNFSRAYQPGDRIVISGPRHMVAQLDAEMPACEVFVAGAGESAFSFVIPLGRAETEDGSAYPPDAFTGSVHRIAVRAFADAGRYRNLALNACDQQIGPPAEPQARTQAFPHATSNSVFRNWPDFRERNAIDGFAEKGHHGVWPYQSWGPDRRDDLWWRVDFGRAVTVDKIRLTIRADFPHDSYWQSAVVEFSDGTSLPVRIAGTAEMQEFSFPARSTEWIRLTQLTAADPARWCSLVEFEAWGRDAP